MRKFIISSLLVILSFHFLAGFLRWYDIIWWLDIPMHLIGGAWVALFFIHFFYKTWRVIESKINFLALLLLVLGFVALVGVLWEFYEYLSDVYLLKVHPLNFAPNPATLPDTMTDLLNDLIGGLAVSFILFPRIKKFKEAAKIQTKI